MTALLVATLAAALVSMVVRLATRAADDPDAARKGARFFLGAGDFLLHWFVWVLGPVERLALRHGLPPDAANAGGLAFGALAGILIGGGWLEPGGWAMILAGVCDVLDGRIARARQVSSAYGRFIDSTLDRFVECFAFLGFAWYLRADPLGGPLVAAALSGSLLVSYTKARGETVNVSGSGGLMQRGERLALTAVVCLLDPPISAALGQAPGTGVRFVLALVALGAWATAIQRTVWIASRLR
jgi:CDP-diacylglycerol--glycerol-3-phosphate 3-phosphatidyltransferase